MGNSSNAYITKQPNAQNPSDWINQQEQTGLQYDAIKRQKEKDAQDRQDKDREGFDSDKAFDIDMSTTGDARIDQMLAPIYTGALVKNREATIEMEKAFETYGYNSKEYREANKAQDNINYLPKLIKGIITPFSSLSKEETTLLASGGYAKDPSKIAKWQEFTKNGLSGSFSKDGNLILKLGDEVFSAEQFNEKTKDLFGVTKLVDMGDVMKKTTGMFKDQIQQSVSGLTTTKITNSWEDTVDENGEKINGLESNLRSHYTNLVTDEVANGMYANMGVWDYNKEGTDQDKRKSQLIEKLVNDSKPLVTQSKEVTKKQYSGGKNTPGVKSTNGGLSFVKTTGNNDVYSIDAKNINTNKSARPESYKEVVYDRANNSLSIKREKFIGDKNAVLFKDYEQSVESQNNAYDAWIANKDEAKSNNLYADYESKVQNAKVKKEALSKNSSDWEEDTITDETTITRILSKELGLDSYPKILSYFKGDEKEKVTKEKKYVGLDADGNPMFE
jgi:hypothetical protein